MFYTHCGGFIEGSIYLNKDLQNLTVRGKLGEIKLIVSKDILIDENTNLNPQNPYAESKIKTENFSRK